MKRQTRWLIGLAVAFVALALIGVAIQTIRSLLWDLSYFLPPWLLTPLLLLGLLSLGVGIALILWIWRERVLPFWQALAAAALLGGTLGNGLDRWRFGYVIDFLALEPIDFPIFNGADVAINLAVLCFAIELWTRRGDTRRG